MALLNPGVNPTERLFKPETVCVLCTGLYIEQALRHLAPATVAEVLALGIQAGAPNGKGANYTNLNAAMSTRYGLHGKVYEGAAAAQAAVLAAAKAGPCIVGLAGDQALLTPAWQAGNHVGHSIVVIYPGGGSIGTQLDPLAPAHYQGDAFGPAELAKFCTAAIIFTAPEADMTTITTIYPAKRTWHTKGGSLTGYRQGPAPLTKTSILGAGSPAHSDAEVNISPTPAGWPAGPYQHVVDGVMAGYLLADSTISLDPVPAPPAPGVPQAQYDADVKAAYNAGVTAAAAAAAAVPHK